MAAPYLRVGLCLLIFGLADWRSGKVVDLYLERVLFDSKPYRRIFCLNVLVILLSS